MNNSDDLDQPEPEGIDEELQSMAQDIAEAIRVFAGIFVFMLKLGELMNEERPEPSTSTTSLISEDDAYLADDYNGWEHPGDCVSKEQKADAILEQYGLKVYPNSGETYGPDFERPCTSKKQKRAAISRQCEPVGKAALIIDHPLSTQQAKASFKARFYKGGKAAQQAMNHQNYLCVRIPDGFPITGAIMDNNAGQGLLHTIIRHGPDWEAVIPKYRDIFERLSEPIRQFVEAASGLADDKNHQTEHLRDDFRQLLDRQATGNDYKRKKHACTAITAMAGPSSNQAVHEAYLATWWENPGQCTTKEEKEAAVAEQYSPPSTQASIQGVQAGAPAHQRNVVRFSVEKAEERLEKLAKTALQFDKPCDLHVPFPSMFTFTGDILDSDVHQGLLHTILRHSPQWVEVDSVYKDSYDKLSTQTKTRIAAISALGYNKYLAAQKLCGDFMNYTQNGMASADFKVLYNLQQLVYKYLRIRTDHGRNYDGEAVSKSKRVWIFFYVGIPNLEYMVVCPSIEPGNAIVDFDANKHVLSSRKPESRRNANETDDEGWGWTVGLGAALLGAAAWGAASWYNSRNEEDQPRSHVQTSAPIRHVHMPTYTPAEPAQIAEAPPTAEEEETFLADDYNGWEHPGNCTSRARKSEAIQQYRDAVESRIYAPRRNGRAGAALTTLEAIIQFDKHKRENGEAARQAFKKRSLLEVPMPSGFESTCAILDNNGYQGLLHTILRHSPEWKDVAPGYANIYQRLSEQTRAAISKISHLADNNQKRAQQMIKEFKKSLGTMPANDCKILQNLQGIIYDYLCKTINAWNYAGEGANPSDFVQFFFQESGNASIGYMVVCISKTVDGSVPKFDDPRPVSNINTIYFVDEHTLRGRKVSECFSLH
ncbi:unnamed protein product, partial [Mesorhabditis spiculigera]